MPLPRLGITIPFDAPLVEHPALLRALADTDFWTGETARGDAFSPLLFAAADPARDPVQDALAVAARV